MITQLTYSKATAKQAPGYESKEKEVMRICGFRTLQSMPKWVILALRTNTICPSIIIEELNSVEFCNANYYGMDMKSGKLGKLVDTLGEP